MWVGTSRHFSRKLCAYAAFAALLPIYAIADIPLVSIVRTNDPVPGSPGANFVFFGTSAININGTVSFRSQTSQFGVFTGTSGGLIQRVAQGSDPAPDLPDGTTFALFDENIPINSHGAVAFTSIYSPNNAGSGHGAFTNNGIVNFADFQLLEANLGKISPSLNPAPANAIYLADPTTVPEPGLMSLLGTALALGLLRRRKHR